MSCFIDRNEWPWNLPDLTALDYHVWGAMLGRYQKCTPTLPIAEDYLAIDME